MSKITKKNYQESMTDFFLRYCDIYEDGYTEDKYITPEAAKDCVELLLEHKIFLSEKDIKLAALKQYLIILPAEIFETSA